MSNKKHIRISGYEKQFVHKIQMDIYEFIVKYTEFLDACHELKKDLMKIRSNDERESGVLSGIREDLRKFFSLFDSFEDVDFNEIEYFYRMYLQDIENRDRIGGN